MKRRVISGADIVSKRSWRKAELSDAFLNQGLGCYRPHSVEKEYSGQSCITCVGDGASEQAEPDDECFYGRRGCGGPSEVNFDVYLQRLMECDFDLEDIEKFEDEHFADKRRGKTPEDIIQWCLENNITDPREIARKLDDTFTEKMSLSHLELGRLLPADQNISIAADSQRDRGKRLRGLKK